MVSEIEPNRISAPHLAIPPSYRSTCLVDGLPRSKMKELHEFLSTSLIRLSSKDRIDINQFEYEVGKHIQWINLTTFHFLKIWWRLYNRIRSCTNSNFYSVLSDCNDVQCFTNLFLRQDVKLEKQNILHLAANGNPRCLRTLLSHLKYGWDTFFGLKRPLWITLSVRVLTLVIKDSMLSDYSSLFLGLILTFS